MAEQLEWRVAAGKKSAEVNKALYGEDFYRVIGKMGGKVKVKKGFAAMTKKQRQAAGYKGGMATKKKMGWK